MFFARVGQKEFLGYAKVISEIKALREIQELQNYVLSSMAPSEKLWAFRIEWKSKYTDQITGSVRRSAIYPKLAQPKSVHQHVSRIQ